MPDNTTLQPIEDPVARDLVADLANAQAKLAEITSQVNELKALARERFAVGEYHIGGRPTLRVTVGRKFDVQSAVMLLPTATDRQACLKVTYDPARVKAKLTGDQIDACMVPNGDNRITLL